MLALRNITHTYGTARVLTGVSLEISPKDCVCIVGEGGSGKSTLVRLLIRAQDPTSGSVEVDGIDLRKVPPAILQLYRRRLGVAFQEPMLLQHATVAENIALPLDLFGKPEQLVKRMTDDLLKRLHLAHTSQSLAGDLSMSERSLVGLARAMITNPMIIIADEPLQHLDEAQRTSVTTLLKNMHKNGTTLILLSREAATADAFDARIVTLAGGKIANAQTQEKKNKIAAKDTHRILEETEHRVHTVLDTPAETPAKKTGGDGKKIRITSIGSGL